MAIDVLAQGRLTKAPEQRTSAAGKSYCTAQMRAATDGDESALVSLIAFRREVVEALLALDAGDSLAVCGRAKPSAWSDKASGEPRAGLSVVVERLLTPYHLNRKRTAAQGDDREPDEPTPVRAPDRAAAARPASRRPVPVGAGIADMPDDDPFGP